MNDIKDIVRQNILHQQTYVVEELFNRGAIPDKYLARLTQDILQWWLVTPNFARRLRLKDEAIVEALGCSWWGRATAGQLLVDDEVIREICNSDE